jgi:diguanylate cyclase (GGDEF)-like protein
MDAGTHVTTSGREGTGPLQPTSRGTDAPAVQSPHRPDAPASSAPALWAVVGCIALFATGMGPRPGGTLGDVVYDVVLYNSAYLPAALACWQAARRETAERTAWGALAVSLVLSAVGYVLRSTGVGSGSALPLADVCALTAYLGLYVTLVGLIRPRVRRFHPSMWLDGVIGALGTTAVGVAFLVGPVLERTGADVPAVQLVWPTADVLLLALLVAVGAILGVRPDRTLVTVIAAMGCTLAGDVVLLHLSAADRYVAGGPLDLTWLAGVALAALAAHRARTPAVTVAGDAESRVGWRVVALPLACNVASLVVLASGWGGQMPRLAAWAAIGCVVAALVRTLITFREVRAFNEVREQARTDELTGLPNRRALFEEIETVLVRAPARRPAALLLDLDGSRTSTTASATTPATSCSPRWGPRLRDGLRADDVLARLGGDEFAVLLSACDEDQAHGTAVRLRELLLQPFTVEGIRLHVGVSIGVATAPRPAGTVKELLRCADVAMYAAKSGRTGVRVYVPDPDGGSSDRLRTMEDLRTALETDELEVHLQPQVDLVDGHVVGAEALVRWRHPRRGLLSPADLLPAAEQAGLLRPLAERVLDLALAAAASWWPVHGVPVSVNLSAANVTDLDLPWKVEAALARHGLPPAALTLELVEDTLMTDPERGRLVLGELRRLGARTSIDDYGTGYSSLPYLRHLPADELKLDRSLTAEVDTDPRAAAIVGHPVALAHDLGLRLVAEGVEDLATGAVLRDVGCDVAQGYAVARPMPVADFKEWLARHPAPLAEATVPG